MIHVLHRVQKVSLAKYEYVCNQESVGANNAARRWHQQAGVNGHAWVGNAVFTFAQ
jgi:hypothetical protein